MLEPAVLRERVVQAFDHFLVDYAHWGAHNYYGWDRIEDGRNFRGPTFWSESDCVLRFALTLERVFPHQVHLELPVVGWVFANYDPGTEKKQFVDIVVSDVRDFVEDETSQERFRTRMHEVFVEAKYFPAGCSKTWRYDHVRKIPSIRADAARLADHVERGRCAVAAVLIVDDDDLWEAEGGATSAGWPGTVMQLLASPGELSRRGTAARRQLHVTDTI
jgi:hypothetical protein